MIFLNYLQIHTTTVIMQKKVTRDSMYIFRNELELVFLVIGWGDLRLFIWGGRGYRVDASRKLRSCIFHWFRENPVENILVMHFMSIFWP